MKFTAVLSKDEDGGYDISIPVLPGCRTWGKTKAEAAKHIKEAAKSYLKSLAKEGDPVPSEAGLQTVLVG